MLCAGYLRHPFSKSMIVLLIYSFFSELWPSLMKGHKNISCVSIHDAEGIVNLLEKTTYIEEV